MEWTQESCKNILVVRADNMGDLIMSSPSIRALKIHFQAKITVLTSKMGNAITRQIPEIDDVIVFDFPWVKSELESNQDQIFEVVEKIKQRCFDAAVIYTVCSQNPLPAAMLIYLAGIPKSLAYCRENPYHLITNWVPDPEPYSLIRHQVRRDLELLNAVGVNSENVNLSLHYKDDSWVSTGQKLQQLNVDITKPYFIFHPGVSEEKRKYPEDKWIELINDCIKQLEIPILLTGTASEKGLTGKLASSSTNCFSIAGLLSLEEFSSLIDHSLLVVSVNTGTIHIAAALKTPVIVLYALTNPQHLPWKTKGKAFYYDVPKSAQSKNEVIGYMSNHLLHNATDFNTLNIIESIKEILNNASDEYPELTPLKISGNQS